MVFPGGGFMNITNLTLILVLAITTSTHTHSMNLFDGSRTSNLTLGAAGAGLIGAGMALHPTVRRFLKNPKKYIAELQTQGLSRGAIARRIAPLIITALAATAASGLGIAAYRSAGATSAPAVKQAARTGGSGTPVVNTTPPTPEQINRHKNALNVYIETLTEQQVDPRITEADVERIRQTYFASCDRYNMTRLSEDQLNQAVEQKIEALLSSALNDYLTAETAFDAAAQLAEMHKEKEEYSTAADAAAEKLTQAKKEYEELYAHLKQTHQTIAQRIDARRQSAQRGTGLDIWTFLGGKQVTPPAVTQPTPTPPATPRLNPSTGRRTPTRTSPTSNTRKPIIEMSAEELVADLKQAFPKILKDKSSPQEIAEAFATPMGQISSRNLEKIRRLHSLVTQG